MVRERSTDLLIVGGGVGGCTAAMAACSLGLRVIMTEPTAWIGGQFTSQIVPTDEHPWIEHFGCTARYRKFRNSARTYYRDHYPLTPDARANANLNPGRGWVSRLCIEPRVALAIFDQMLAEARLRGLLEIWKFASPISTEMNGDQIESVQIRDRDGNQYSVSAKYVIDATELGELLPLCNAEYVIGAESQRETNEKHAVDGDAMPHDQQGITWCFAMGYDPENDHTIEKPARYEFWKQFQPTFWPGPLLGWQYVNPHKMEPSELPMFPRKSGDLSFFDYRRVICKENFQSEGLHEVTIVNWPQNDYFLEPIIDVTEDEFNARVEDAKQLSLSLLYWLQTEAPRHDGGTGYPGCYLRGDVTGTPDGFAMAPYIRESRRIKAEFTIFEQHVAAHAHPDADRAPGFFDSVGVGCYRLDLHPSTGGRNTIDMHALPFEIPLGALIPVRIKNLIPACKNIGTTHLTNGCYRLHPIEWNIGEAAGLLAAQCILQNYEMKEIRNDDAKLADFQRLCVAQGIELHWPKLGAI